MTELEADAIVQEQSFLLRTKDKDGHTNASTSSKRDVVDSETVNIVQQQKLYASNKNKR